MKAGSFTMFAPAIVLASVSLAGAQQQHHHQPQPPPPSAAALPAMPAALSVPDPLAGMRPGPRDLYRSPDGSDRFQHLSHHPVPPVGVVPGVYVPGPFYYPSLYHHYMAAETSYVPRHRESVARGGLVLQTIPDIAQVFVDGYYVGLAEEFGLHGRAMDLAAGAHRIELRAPGYETLAFSLMISPNEIVRYRGDMQLASAKPVVNVPAAPAAPRSFYVIPNCYAGDKPPSGALPKGCDPKKLQTRK